ncbi:hypothetical protein DPMN_065199 [Dreissena polymorpha]|uniref:Uncharacterized protein n=1 Tax=Dreissena polymorpha TaxID=45954 RepID=A0A9D4CDM3_DREPO|nr:hypothetical protein DPMN_065199 [Dreissena polymorpha]
MSMFTDDGKMIKTRKSDFMKKLEELLPESQTMTRDPEVMIFDGITLVQILPVQSELANFKSMASAFQSYALRKARELSSHVKAIHIVFDKYSGGSIKTQTRQERGDLNNNKTGNINVQGELYIPKDWKMLLSSGSNKERLIEY